MQFWEADSRNDTIKTQLLVVGTRNDSSQFLYIGTRHDNGRWTCTHSTLISEVAHKERPSTAISHNLATAPQTVGGRYLGYGHMS